MLIVKITPAWLDTSGFLLTVIIFWWLCRLCASMRTLCDSDVCFCDYVGRISCTCTAEKQELEVTRGGSNKLISTTSSLIIKDCATVRIQKKSFEELTSLMRIVLVNIKNLTLEEHSFSWSDSTIYETYANNGIEIVVENSTVSNLPTYVFRGRIDAIAFKNVRIDLVKSYAFTSLAGTKTIVFRDCEFGHVENQAFKKFVVENSFAVTGGRFLSPLPSRAIMDVIIKNELQISGVVFERVRSGAFRVHGPRKFQIQNCFFGRLEGEAFVVHTRGPVFIDDNEFRAIETGAFVGVSVEKHVLDLSGHQELIFENNTIAETRRAALLFNVNSFMPKLDWIYLDSRCDCRALRGWLSELIVFSHRYPQDTFVPSIRLDEIMSCRGGEEYVRLKDFSSTYCGDRTQPVQIFAFVGLLAALALVTFIIVYWLWYKNRKTRWINVPQSSPIHEATAMHPDTAAEQSSPCYEEPSTSRRQVLVVPDGRQYKETELHVIVECTEPATAATVTTSVAHEYANRFRERNQQYSNWYAELTKDYERRPTTTRRQLLTSDL